MAKKKVRKKYQVRRFSEAMGVTVRSFDSPGRSPAFTQESWARVQSLRKRGKFDELPETHLTTNSLYIGDDEGRAVPLVEVLKKRVEMPDQNDGYHSILVASTIVHKVKLYFPINGNGNQWFYVEEHFRDKVQRRSIIYSSRSIAIFKWKTKKITWVEVTSLTKSQLGSQPG